MNKWQLEPKNPRSIAVRFQFDFRNLGIIDLEKAPFKLNKLRNEYEQIKNLRVNSIAAE